MTEESVSENLEEAAEEYVQEAYSHIVDRNVGKADFILGDQWHKKKLLNRSNGMYPCFDEEGDLVGYSIYYEAEGAYKNIQKCISY